MSNQLDRIDRLVKQLKMNIDKQSSLYLDAYPDMTLQEARELYLLNKIATLTIAMEDIGKRIKELEKELE